MGEGSNADSITWRHADGSVRVDHMDAQAGDYYGPAPITCEGCGRTTADPDRWDPEADTGRIFCDACWPHRHLIAEGQNDGGEHDG